MPPEDARSSLAGARVVVTGGSGFLGRSVVARLRARGVTDIQIPRRAEFDLTREGDAERMYRELKPEVVLV